MLDRGFTHYTAIGGMLDVKEVIAKKLRKENKIKVNPEQIIITVGAKESILLSLMTFIDPGESVIVPNPGYLAYIPMVESLNGVPLSVQLNQDEGFEYNLDKVKQLMHPKKTRILILNSPSNPTGTVFSKKKLEEIADFVVEHGLIVISDEAYEKFVYDNTKHVSIGSLNGMEDYVISIFSFSKTYAMPGFRVGYAAGPENAIKAMTRLKLGTTLSTPTISQLSAIKALQGTQAPVRKMIKEYNRRRKLVMKRLDEIPGFKTLEPKGAFYVFPNIRSFGMTSVEFARFLLRNAKVLVVPGTEFGKYGEGFIRISYATAYNLIEKAMDKIESALQRFK
jgi:aspartate/methionine/tyrosine aminotransferase